MPNYRPNVEIIAYKLKSCVMSHIRSEDRVRLARTTTLHNVPPYPLCLTITKSKILVKKRFT